MTGAVRRIRFLLLAAILPAVSATGQPVTTLDLADPLYGVRRIYGATGSGSYGVPVAGGWDVNNDGFADYAIAFLTADPLGRTDAGEVDLIFGDGKIGGTIDTALDQSGVLRIYGDGTREVTGSEIWMEDVTGDGRGDLLLCRQNFSPDAGRPAAGALTIVVGGAWLSTLGPAPVLDLRSPPPGAILTHVVGAAAGDRLCIWTRTGDVTGDLIADLVIGADQEDGAGETHRGAVYVLQGGAHLAAGGTLDLSDLSATELKGRVAHITPPSGSSEHHVGATCQIADLDGNGVGEVLAAATLNRAGALLGLTGGPVAHATGGSSTGTLYIVWDDNLSTPWPDTFEISLDSPPGSLTTIAGGFDNRSFGEEILGGLDYDADGTRDLFVGDLVGDGSPSSNRPQSGVGYVFFDAAGLKGLDTDMNLISVTYSTLLGPIAGALGADTASHGDFDGDGTADLAFCSPHADPQGREHAGAVHVLRGRSGGWPLVIDTASLPVPSQVESAEIQGGHGQQASDGGDTLCYSAAFGDIDGDGITDLLINEMRGNGTDPGAIDVGNLLVIDGTSVFAVFQDGFETGDLSRWTNAVP